MNELQFLALRIIKLVNQALGLSEEEVASRIALAAKQEKYLTLCSK